MRHRFQAIIILYVILAVLGEYTRTASIATLFFNNVEAKPKQSFSPWSADAITTVNNIKHKKKKKVMKSDALTQGGRLSLLFYQKVISPQDGAVCRFSPTCSRYSKESILKKGLLKGTLMSAERLMRDHPFSDGGKDPVK